MEKSIQNGSNIFSVGPEGLTWMEKSRINILRCMHSEALSEKYCSRPGSTFKNYPMEGTRNLNACTLQRK